MRRAVLIGSPDSKRWIYLKRAAEEEKLAITFADWKDWEKWRGQPLEERIFFKLDPPQWKSCSLRELGGLLNDYLGRLRELGGMEKEREIEFLNHPSAIEAVLDKRKCKEKLTGAGIPVTEQLCGGERLTAEGLLELMCRRRMYQVFIKPVNGSGAAGVTAFRYQSYSGRMALYTCAFVREDGCLVNTKRLRRFSEPEEVFSLLDRLFTLDCIVERWYAKAEYQGFSYDLRAVVQDGRLDFLLGRLSKGPITNLHLNNHPLKASELGLSGYVIDEVDSLCRRSMDCYPGLRSAGIDILLEKGSLKPRIIEMNAQGDLIYQDIYHENIIYRHQARMMKEWLEQDAGGEVHVAAGASAEDRTDRNEEL